MASPGEYLTEREFQVLDLKSRGLTDEEIKAKLNVSVNTVKYHVVNILGKLQAKNATHAVRIAFELNILGNTKNAPPASFAPGLVKRVETVIWDVLCADVPPVD
jgi:DNA-binding CsgD family transcriptional regulator